MGDFFDLTKPVGLDETWVSIFVVTFLIAFLYFLLKIRIKNKT
ncbi:hypothetical protein HEBU111660_05305 [Helicobacter burdigaliensis]